MIDLITQAAIVDQETDGENAAVLINDNKRATNESLTAVNSEFQSIFETGSDFTLPAGGAYDYWVMGFVIATGQLSGGPVAGRDDGGTVVSAVSGDGITGFYKKFSN